MRKSPVAPTGFHVGCERTGKIVSATAGDDQHRPLSFCQYFEMAVDGAIAAEEKDDVRIGR